MRSLPEDKSLVNAANDLRNVWNETTIKNISLNNTI